jgi:hypothetical protein
MPPARLGRLKSVSLFAQKCVRCSARTRNVYLDKPTCPACVEALEVALAEGFETKRACPADGAMLKKQIVHGVVIDRCESCNGVWLDAGEMERMNQDVADEVWRATALGRPYG